MRRSDSRLNLPERTIRYQFPLTPLADAMFQLLIFFMLASSLTPYSLVTLKTAPGSAVETGTPGGAGSSTGTAEVGDANTVTWFVDNDSLTVAGTQFAMDQLPDLVAALGERGTPPDVVIIMRARARVQDLATVMEGLDSADVASVQIRAMAS